MFQKWGVFLFAYHLKGNRHWIKWTFWSKSWKVQFSVAEIPIIWSSTSEKLWVHELRSKKEPKKAILLGAKTCYMRKRVRFSSTFSFFGLWFCTLIKQLLGVLLWAIIPFQMVVGSKNEPIYSTRSQIFVRPQKPAILLKWVD